MPINTQDGVAESPAKEISQYESINHVFQQ